MEIIRDIDACRSALGWRRNQRRLGMVITSAGLHPGHLAIVNQCRSECDMTVVCITPNPDAQASAADAARLLNLDAAQLEALTVDVLFAPDEQALFPLGRENAASVWMPPSFDKNLRSDKAASAQATLYLKLIGVVNPNSLFVGEKDFPAWMTCRQLIEQFYLPVEFRSVPVIREADGLPAAEDLHHLSAEQRRQACVLQQTLQDLAFAISRGARNYSKLEQTAKVALRGAGLSVDYIIIRDENTLAAPDSQSIRLRILTRARLGGACITDNLQVTI